MHKPEFDIGFTCGSFDLLHAGHLLMLEKCKTNCNYLIVGLQTDPSVDRDYKNKPVQEMYERWAQLKACKYVDEIIPYSTEADLLNLLKTVYHEVRFLGSDWVDKEFTGFKLSTPINYLHRHHDYSSSNLRQRIVDADKNK